MYQDRDVDQERPPRPGAAALTQDLELDTLFGAMARGDRFLFEVARAAVLASQDDPAVIRYRQDILGECLAEPALIREVYGLAVEAIEGERRIYGGLLDRYPDALLRRCTEALELFVGVLKRLRRLADAQAGRVRSRGLAAFFAMIARELDDEYVRDVEGHLRRLRFPDGVLMSSELGKGNKGTHYVLRQPRPRKRCLNLHEHLSQKGEPTCFPEPLPVGACMLSSRGLYDVCLSLSVNGRVVGNAVSADGKRLVMITGANRGGKSTLLRAVGLAHLMMQCGMFVPAESFRANVCDGLFTHYKREEDATMKSGKLDEELNRMSAIVDEVTVHSVVLLNESFASTNEREGSEIARQIVGALLESGVKVFYVTHLFDLAEGLHREQGQAALFLRAERLADGRRTFRLLEGEPLPTSYGEDLYRRIVEGRGP